jgi:ribosomal protein S18 acetylase RimI-like enzyme
MPARVEIRPFQPGDRQAVISLWDEVFPDDPPWNEPATVIERKLTVQPELFLVALVDGRIVGTVLAGFDGVRGWVHHLGVHGSCRRQGVASALMRAAEEGLAALGCPKLNLQVRATNAPVVAFYRAIGYDVEERTSLAKRLLNSG